MAVFTATTPGAAQTLAVSQPILAANNSYLQTSVGIDHNFTANTATAKDGYHKIIHFVNQVADPAAIAGTGQLYTKTVGATQQLFYETGAGTAYQLTAAATAGVNGTVTVGGIIIKWGTFTVPPAATATIAFPVAFPTNCYVVTLQQTDLATSTNANSVITAKTVNNFTYIDKAGNHQFYIAIGN